jgi:quercetin dioxygenase-like cupin family protein
MTFVPSAPILRQPGEGRPIPGPEGLIVKATAAETGGSVGVLEARSEPGFGPPQHIHHDCDELFYVLEGSFEFLVGERRMSAGPGAFVFVPRGSVHASKVTSPGPARVLIAFVPGGQEGAFDELAGLGAGPDGPPPPTDERIRAIVENYHSTIVGPPL